MCGSYLLNGVGIICFLGIRLIVIEYFVKELMWRSIGFLVISLVFLKFDCLCFNYVIYLFKKICFNCLLIRYFYFFGLYLKEIYR